MMVSTGLPELSSEKDLNYLKETLVCPPSSFANAINEIRSLQFRIFRYSICRRIRLESTFARNSARRWRIPGKHRWTGRHIISLKTLNNNIKRNTIVINYYYYNIINYAKRNVEIWSKTRIMASDLEGRLPVSRNCFCSAHWVEALWIIW